MVEPPATHDSIVGTRLLRSVRPLAQVEHQFRDSLAGRDTTKLHRSILQSEAAEVGVERPLLTAPDLEPPVLDHALMGIGFRAENRQFCPHAGVIVDLDKMHPGSVFVQTDLARRRDGSQLPVACNPYRGDAKGVEDGLDHANCECINGLLFREFDLGIDVRRPRGAELLKRLPKATYLRQQRLPLNVKHDCERISFRRDPASRYRSRLPPPDTSVPDARERDDDRDGD